jgi:hypothetical protein
MQQQLIEIRHSKDVANALAEIGRQAPFALSLALNYTANAAQREIRQGLGAFTLRRKEYILRTIYRGAVDKATKSYPFATVRIQPGRDVLAKHEEGGSKTPRSGNNVAIPLPAVREAAGNAVIPKRLRPSGLQRDARVRRIVTPSGTYLVRMRAGTGRGRMLGWRTEFLYRLKPSVPIRPRLGFQRNAMIAINRDFEKLAFEAIDRAMATRKT